MTSMQPETLKLRTGAGWQASSLSLSPVCRSLIPHPASGHSTVISFLVDSLLRYISHLSKYKLRSSTLHFYPAWNEHAIQWFDSPFSFHGVNHLQRNMGLVTPLYGCLAFLCTLWSKLIWAASCQSTQHSDSKQPCMLRLTHPTSSPCCDQSHWTIGSFIYEPDKEH